MRQKRNVFARLVKVALLAAMVSAVVASLSLRSQADGGSQFVAGEIIVELRPGASVDAVNARMGTQTRLRIYGTNFYRLRTPNGKKENKYRKRLSRDPDVLSAALNPLVMSPISVFGRSTFSFPDGHPTTGQTKSLYDGQQVIGNLDAVHVRSRGAGVIVAVIDTGVDRTHPDIADHLWTNPRERADGSDGDGDGLKDDVRGWDFIDNDNDPGEQPADPQTTVAGHGTFIAGLIALVAPSAKIMPLRAFDPKGLGDAFSVAAAIKYATDHGARVINLSFGSPDDSQVMHDAIVYAHQRSVLLVAAVGNDNQTTDTSPEFPAHWQPEVMGVAAVDSNDHKADFSNFGSDVSVSAHGVRLYSLYPQSNNNPDYAMWSGTSFAAPLATSEAALILEDNPNTYIRGTIQDTAVNIDALNRGFEGKLGKGRIDPLAALQGFQPTPGNRGDISLIGSGVEIGPQGKASVAISSSEQWIEMEAAGLQPRAAYKIVVDGFTVIDATNPDDPYRERATASNFGSFKVKCASEPGRDWLPLPPAINPVTGIRRVEIRDPQNRVVIANEFGVPSPGGGPGQSVEKEAALSSTGVMPNVKGRARADVEPEREELRIEADDLTSGVAYTILADGVNLGSFVARSEFVGVEFTSDGSSGHVLPQSLRPVTKIKQVGLRNPSGQIVLQGTFQPGGDDFGGGGDGGGSGGGGGGGGGDQEVRREAPLYPTGVIEDAKGKVKTRVSSGRESIEIEAEKLTPGAQYRIVVDGFSLGTFMADGSGEIKLELSTENGSLPPQVRPVSNIQHVNVIDSLGRTVLTGGPPT